MRNARLLIRHSDNDNDNDNNNNNCCLFERPYKVKKNGVFLFGISFFIVGIFNTFLYYANEESDDVIGAST